MKDTNSLTEELFTGIPEIDEQHDQLISQLSNLNTLLFQGFTVKDVNIFLNYLDNYIALHFLTEENYMHRFKYKNADEHKQEHKNFYENYTYFKKLLEEEADVNIVSSTLNSKIIQWLENHLKTQDKKLANFLFSTNNEN